jgi:hypothetical protein
VQVLESIMTKLITRALPLASTGEISVEQVHSSNLAALADLFAVVVADQSAVPDYRWQYPLCSRKESDLSVAKGLPKSANALGAISVSWPITAQVF